MTSLAWFFFGAAIFFIALYFHRKYYVLQYLFFLRYPLLLGMFLLLLPLTAMDILDALFRNLFVHDRPSALAIVTLLALLVAWETMYLVGFLFEHIPQRVKLPFDRGAGSNTPLMNEIPRWLRPQPLGFLIFGLLAIPIMAASAWYSSEGRIEGNAGQSMSLLDIVLGLALGAGIPTFLVLVITYVAKGKSRVPFLGEPVRWVAYVIGRFLAVPAHWFVRFTAWVDRSLFGSTTIVTDPETREIRTRTFRIAVVFYFAVITFIVYLSFGLFPPEAGDNLVRFDLPALIFVLLLAMLVGWILPWLSFLLDRHRMIPEIAIAIVVMVFYNIFGTDHYYHIRITSQNGQKSGPSEELAGNGISPTSQAGARRRWAGLPEATRPIIIAASGGGITAAYWVAVVLSQIEKHLTIRGAPNVGFSDAVYMVSGTSG